MDIQQTKENINAKLLQKEAEFLLKRKQDAMEGNKKCKDIWHCFGGLYQPDFPYEDLLPCAELTTPVLEQNKITKLNMFFFDDHINVSYRHTSTKHCDDNDYVIFERFIIKSDSFGSSSYYAYKAYDYNTLDEMDLLVLNQIHNSRFDILAKMAKDLGVEDVSYGV